MATTAEKKAAEAAAKREKTEREAQAKRVAAEKKAAANKAAAEKKAEQNKAANEAKAKAAADKQAAAKAKTDAAAQAKQAKADSKAKAAADKQAAAQKAATTYNDQGLNAAQQAQIAKLQKIANQPVSTYQGLGGGSNQAAIDKAKADIEKIEAQGKTILDKQYQEKQAPKIQETKNKADANRAAEAQQATQQQAAQQQQLQQHQQQYGQEMAQRQDPRQSYANPYFQMTENMPAPVGMSQGPNSQQAQTTMIGAGGNQPQQMSPAQMAQMAQMQGGIMGGGGMPQGMPPGMGQGQQGTQMTPQEQTAMQRFHAEEAMMGRPPQADTFQPQGPQPQGGTPAQLMAMLQARAQQGQPVRQDMSTFNAAPQQQMGPNHPMYALGGLLKGYR